MGGDAPGVVSGNWVDRVALPSLRQLPVPPRGTGAAASALSRYFVDTALAASGRGSHLRGIQSHRSPANWGPHEVLTETRSSEILAQAAGSVASQRDSGVNLPGPFSGLACLLQLYFHADVSSPAGAFLVM